MTVQPVRGADSDSTRALGARRRELPRPPPRSRQASYSTSDWATDIPAAHHRPVGRCSARLQQACAIRAAVTTTAQPPGARVLHPALTARFRSGPPTTRLGRTPPAGGEERHRRRRSPPWGWNDRVGRGAAGVCRRDRPAIVGNLPVRDSMVLSRRILRRLGCKSDAGDDWTVVIGGRVRHSLPTSACAVEGSQ